MNDMTIDERRELEALRHEKALRQLAHDAAATQVAVVNERLNGIEATFDAKMSTLARLTIGFGLAAPALAGAAATLITHWQPASDTTEAALQLVTGIFT